MTKQEFVNDLAQRSGLSNRDAAKAVDAFLEGITDALSKGDNVQFTGFGRFSSQHRAERQGVNPRNPSQKVTIPAANVPKFSAGSTLKQAVKAGRGGGGGNGGGGGGGGGDGGGGGGNGGGGNPY